MSSSVDCGDPRPGRRKKGYQTSQNGEWKKQDSKTSRRGDGGNAKPLRGDFSRERHGYPRSETGKGKEHLIRGLEVDAQQRIKPVEENERESE